MTADELATRYTSGPDTPERLKKLHARCQQAKVDYQTVLKLLGKAV